MATMRTGWLLMCLSVSMAMAAPRETKVLFKNQFSANAELFWFDVSEPNGIKMGDIAVNANIDMSSYEGHHFFFKVDGYDGRFETTVGNDDISSYDLVDDRGKPVVVKRSNAASTNKWIAHGTQMMAESKDLSVPIKFTNLHDKSLEIFYDDNGDGITQGYLRENSTMCINSYVGHKFFFTPVGSKKRVAQAVASAASFENILKPDNLSPEVAARVAEEEKFRADYYEKNGFQWLSGYGRPKPKWHMWEAKEVGQKHTVTSKQTLFEREPENHSLEEEQQCRVGEEASFDLEVVSTHPKVFKIMNFLSEAECDHIVQKGKEGLARSTTGGMLSDTRTSQTAWVRRSTSKMMDNIVRRVADLVKIPEKVLTMKQASEEIQLVHYDVGQFYNSHHDWSIEDYNSRYLTLLLYLTDQDTADAGGETAFPKADLKVHPGKGNAILFYNILEDGNVDDLALHAALPVGQGEKWLANVWIWDPQFSRSPGDDAGRL